MSDIQYVTDKRGHRVSAIVPIALFERLISVSELGERYCTVQNEAVSTNNVRYPHEVIRILTSKNCSIQAAWRMYRGMTQKEVAEQLGIKQATISQLEKTARPRRDNRERLAKIYNCLPEQLLLE